MIRRFPTLAVVLLALPLMLHAGGNDSLPELKPTAAMAAETRLVVELLEQAHYSAGAISDIAFDDLLTKFMGQLDYHRLFFTKRDQVLLVANLGPNLLRDLKQGSLEAPFEVFSVYRKNALERIDWILKRLETREWDFTTDEVFRPDRSEAPWPTDRKEADAIWLKRLKYELLQDLLNEKTIEEARDTVRRRYERLQRTVRDFDATEVQEMFLSTLAKNYDPHSSFLSHATMEDFQISMRLSLVGIGAILSSEDGYCVVRELVPGGPAALSNELQPNDRIVAVQQEGEEPVDVIDMKLRRIVEMIRGEKGTTVHLTVVPASAADTATRKQVTLVRDEIRLTASRARASIYEVPDDAGEIHPVGVIRVPTFYGQVDNDDNGNSTADDVKTLIGELKEAGITALVLDLRGNGGGLLSEAIKLTGLFIPSGPVVQIRDSRGRVRTDPDLNPSVAYDGPLAVLVSRNSASASEIVAGALQNYRRAIILGDEATHGKGTVQAIFELSHHLMFTPYRNEKTGATKLTVQKFYLPDGQSTQNRGVIPDIALPSYNNLLATGESDLPNALLWDELDSGDWEKTLARISVDTPVEDSLLERLRERSSSRQETLEEFAYLRENLEWYQRKRDENTVSLNLKRRQLLQKIDREFREEMTERSRELAKLDYPSQAFSFEDEEDTEPSPVDTDRGDDLFDDGLDGDFIDGEENGDTPSLDIQLRESMRILVDFLRLHPELESRTRTVERTARSR